jgi:hypothetical protein
MHELNEDTSKSDLGHSDTFENHVKFPKDSYIKRQIERKKKGLINNDEYSIRMTSIQSQTKITTKDKA